MGCLDVLYFADSLGSMPQKTLHVFTPILLNIGPEMLGSILNNLGQGIANVIEAKKLVVHG